MKNDLKDQVLTQQMSRKQFLQYIGGLVVVLIGMNHFMSVLRQLNPSSTKEAKRGFGSSKFGV